MDFIHYSRARGSELPYGDISCDIVLRVSKPFGRMYRLALGTLKVAGVLEDEARWWDDRQLLAVRGFGRGKLRAWRGVHGSQPG